MISQLIIYKKIIETIFEKQPLKENSSFPREIQLYIESNMKEMIIYKINMNGKNIVLNFYTDKHSRVPDNKDLYKTLKRKKLSTKHRTLKIYKN